jgi:hypothetical protein
MTGFDSKRQSAMDKLVEIQEELDMYDDQKPPMTKDEALKLALEALENHCGNYKLDDAGCERWDKAVTAIKEALAQPDHIVNANKMEQPEQEPVAWAVYYKGGGSKSLHWPENHSPNGDATMFDAVPLVPQRPWVGLTDEECRLTYTSAMESPVRDQVTVCRAIEAKLKEKNT